MTAFYTTVLVLVPGIIAVSLYRVWRGPTAFDRLIAVALVSVNSVVILVVAGFALGRPVLFLDIALTVALLAFLAPIAVAKYMQRSREADPDDPDAAPEAPAGRVGEGGAS